LWPGVLIVSSLALEMLHYVVASVVWCHFYRNQEKLGADGKADLTHDVYLECSIYLLFSLKIIAVLAAYVFLVAYFVRAILLR
jgi:hypothetical protein